jgi:hypothetical protein
MPEPINPAPITPIRLIVIHNSPFPMGIIRREDLEILKDKCLT